MIAELYEALKAAGAPEDKAQAAAKALADHERRFDSIDGKLAALEAQVTVVEMDHRRDVRRSPRPDTSYVNCRLSLSAGAERRNGPRYRR